MKFEHFDQRMQLHWLHEIEFSSLNWSFKDSMHTENVAKFKLQIVVLQKRKPYSIVNIAKVLASVLASLYWTQRQCEECQLELENFVVGRCISQYEWKTETFHFCNTILAPLQIENEWFDRWWCRLSSSLILRFGYAVIKVQWNSWKLILTPLLTER